MRRRRGHQPLELVVKQRFKSPEVTQEYLRKVHSVQELEEWRRSILLLMEAKGVSFPSRQRALKWLQQPADVLMTREQAGVMTNRLQAAYARVLQAWLSQLLEAGGAERLSGRAQQAQRRLAAVGTMLRPKWPELHEIESLIMELE